MSIVENSFWIDDKQKYRSIIIFYLFGNNIDKLEVLVESYGLMDTFDRSVP